MHCHLRISWLQKVGIIINHTSGMKNYIKADWLVQGYTAPTCQPQESKAWSLTENPELLTTSLNSSSFLYFLSQIQYKGQWLLIMILKLISAWVPLIPSLDNFVPTCSVNVLGSRCTRTPAVWYKATAQWWGSVWIMMLVYVGVHWTRH